MRKPELRQFVALALGTILVAGSAAANNLKLTNISVKGRDNNTALVMFDISWENSWRLAVADDPLYLHDAVWMFFKVRLGDKGEWQHVKLVGSGINPDGYGFAEGGTAVELVVPGDQLGIFVHHAEDV